MVLAPFFFLGKDTIFSFLIQEGVWPYRYAHVIPLVTLILKIYGFGFVGLIAGYTDRQTDKLVALCNIVCRCHVTNWINFPCNYAPYQVKIILWWPFNTENIVVLCSLSMTDHLPTEHCR